MLADSVVALGGLTWLIAVAAVALGAAAGWFAHRYGEAARSDALAAYHREEIRVAATARDRARAEAAEAVERYERARSDRGRGAGETKRLTRQLEAATCRAEDAEQRVAHAEAELTRELARLHRPEQGVPARDRDSGNGNGNGNGAPGWLLEHPDGNGKDDLQVIRGLGPVLEKGLNRLGIFHYRQLASLETPDIEWLAPRLNIVPTRIVRDRWVQQAKSLER